MGCGASCHKKSKSKMEAEVVDPANGGGEPKVEANATEGNAATTLDNNKDGVGENGSEKQQGDARDGGAGENKESGDTELLPPKDSDVMNTVDQAVNELEELNDSKRKDEAAKKRRKRRKKQKKQAAERRRRKGDDGRDLVGHLFLILGPSGVGKDTLINGARDAIGNNEDFVFMRRLITREKASDSIEDHDTVTDQEFERLKSINELGLYWEAHGNKYAIRRKDIKRQLKADRTVVASVSRTVIQQAQDQFGPKSNVTVIEITADPDVIRKRLLGRDRETAAEIEARIQRNEQVSAAVRQVAKDLQVVLNNSTVDEGVDRLLVALEYLPDDMLDGDDDDDDNDGGDDDDGEEDDDYA